MKSNINKPNNKQNADLNPIEHYAYIQDGKKKLL
jgi:hypothetical protein